ncbi:cytochrome P450 [Streptomyces sanglieri]|uniref:cytochrome P450 n=1 Tax=Streptomyces sanglieri TaxID=193460 RepID=UPI003524D9AE
MTVRAGDYVTTDHVAANRDPAAFPGNPHDHDNLFASLPKPSLAFGAGRHYCLGTWLARAELQLALHRLAVRLPALRLTIAADDIVWRHGTVTRSPSTCLRPGEWQPRDRRPYGGAALAPVLGAPNLAYQAANGPPQSGHCPWSEPCVGRW